MKKKRFFRAEPRSKPGLEEHKIRLECLVKNRRQECWRQIEKFELIEKDAEIVFGSLVNLMGRFNSNSRISDAVSKTTVSITVRGEKKSSCFQSMELNFYRTGKTKSGYRIEREKTIRRRDFEKEFVPSVVDEVMGFRKEIKRLFREYCLLINRLDDCVKSIMKCGDFDSYVYRIRLANRSRGCEGKLNHLNNLRTEVVAELCSLVRNIPRITESIEDLIDEQCIIVNSISPRRNNVITVTWEIPKNYKMSYVGPRGPGWFIQRSNRDVRYLKRIKPPTKSRVKSSFQGRYISSIITARQRIDSLSHQRSEIIRVLVSIKRRIGRYRPKYHTIPF